ncbi:MAG: sugar phosphate nucleotidyltransferase [Promethearchaeota archaeon]
MKIIGPMAGVGARLRPFTYNKPKGMLKVAGRRVIAHILDLLKDITRKDTDLQILTGYRNRTIKNYLLEKYSDHFNLSFKIQEPKGYVGDVPYFGGLGEAIHLSEEWYSNQISSFQSKDPDDYSLIFLSDMIPLDGFMGILNTLIGKEFENPQKNNLADDFKDDDEKYKHEYIQMNIHNGKRVEKDIDGILGVMQVPRERASSYGIIEFNERTGLIKKVVEKPKKYISDLAIAGVYLFKPQAMKELYKYLTEEVKKFEKNEGEAQITPAIQGLIDHGFKLASFKFKKGILDFGNPDTLLEGNRFLLKNHGNTLGGPVKRITNSTLTVPSFFGKNVEIKNCVIGPFVSIGDGCMLKDCILRNSVIGDMCSLEKIITDHSIIGDYVIMEDLIKDDLIIGDNSNIRSSKLKSSSDHQN